MIRPLNDNVVLKKEKLVRETASGIVLSQKEEEPEYATVVAVAEGKRNEKGEIIPINLKVGDKVVYKTYSPTKIKIDNEEYLILSSNDILAVIE